MKYLLDTCVISELVARNPNPRVVFWMVLDHADFCVNQRGRLSDKNEIYLSIAREARN